MTWITQHQIYRTAKQTAKKTRHNWIRLFEKDSTGKLIDGEQNIKDMWQQYMIELMDDSLSQKDVQSRNKWRRRIKGQPANPGSRGKMAVKRCVCVSV